MRFVSCIRAITLRPRGRIALTVAMTLAGTTVLATIASPVQSAPRTAAALTLIAGSPDDTSLALAHDLAAVFDGANGPRVLPIVGRGSLADIADLTGLDGIDLAITHTDALNHLKAAGTLGPGLGSRVGIIAKLHDAELHILAGKGIERIEDLAGKTVNLGATGSGTEFTARAILNGLGIKVRSINVGQDAGLAKVASGEIAATLLVTGKPARVLQANTLPEGAKLLDVPFPQSLDGGYMPAKLTDVDYPGLIAQGHRIDTIAVGVVLTALMQDASGTRNQRITGFVDSFFSDITTMHAAAFHPKWRDANVTASLPGWSRHPAAESWLKSNSSASAPPSLPAGPSALASQIDAPVPSDPMLAYAQATRAANGNPAEQERLFRAFLEKSRVRQPAQTAQTTPTP